MHVLRVNNCQKSAEAEKIMAQEGTAGLRGGGLGTVSPHGSDPGVTGSESTFTTPFWPRGPGQTTTEL